jgi:hypothetical protein
LTEDLAHDIKPQRPLPKETLRFRKINSAINTNIIPKQKENDVIDHKRKSTPGLFHQDRPKSAPKRTIYQLVSGLLEKDYKIWKEKGWAVISIDPVEGMAGGKTCILGIHPSETIKNVRVGNAEDIEYAYETLRSLNWSRGVVHSAVTHPFPRLLPVNTTIPEYILHSNTYNVEMIAASKLLDSTHLSNALKIILKSYRYFSINKDIPYPTTWRAFVSFWIHSMCESYWNPFGKGDENFNNDLGSRSATSETSTTRILKCYYPVNGYEWLSKVHRLGTSVDFVVLRSTLE